MSPSPFVFITNGTYPPFSRPVTSTSKQLLSGSSHINSSLPPAQAVSSTPARQPHITQFIPPPSHLVSQTPGNSRLQSIQRTISDRGHPGWCSQYPPGLTSLRRSGMVLSPPGLTVTIAIIPFKVGCFSSHILQQALTTSFKLHLSQDMYMISDQCKPPEIWIQPSNLKVLLDTLWQHRLVTDLTFFNVNRDSDSLIWVDFDLKLQSYLSSIGAKFADPSTLASYDHPVPSNKNSAREYHNLPWLLLKGGRLRHGQRKITPADPVVFSPRTLCSAIGTWGRAASNQPLLFIGIHTSRINCVPFCWLS